MYEWERPSSKAEATNRRRPNSDAGRTGIEEDKQKRMYRLCAEEYVDAVDFATPASIRLDQIPSSSSHKVAVAAGLEAVASVTNLHLDEVLEIPEI